MRWRSSGGRTWHVITLGERRYVLKGRRPSRKFDAFKRKIMRARLLLERRDGRDQDKQIQRGQRSEEISAAWARGRCKMGLINGESYGGYFVLIGLLGAFWLLSRMMVLPSVAHASSESDAQTACFGACIAV